MKQSRFDDRLDGILVRAAIRLQERMELAYSRGRLSEFLMRTGLAAGLGDVAHKGSLLEVQDHAAVLLAQKIREARRKGYLKDYLASIQMEELLFTPVPDRTERTRPVLQGDSEAEDPHHDGATVIQLAAFR